MHTVSMRLIVLIGILIITAILAIYTNIKSRVLQNIEIETEIKKDVCDYARNDLNQEPMNTQNETCAEFPYYSSESENKITYPKKQYHKPSKYSPNLKKLCGAYAVPSYNKLDRS